MPSPTDNIALDFLSDTERDLILEVLRRDEELRQAEDQRVRRLKAELLEIKRKGAKRGSGRYSQRSCGRCQGSLSLLAFTSKQCPRCHHLVCSNCRASLHDGFWLCVVCIKESDLRKSTGDWFYNLRVNRFTTTPGHELVRSSLRQRPVLKKYVAMGDVLLNNSESSRGPPVPIPRQKGNATSKRPSSENGGSVTSMASSETKGDGFVYHGPPSEYSGSVGSTASFEMKGIDGLLKPSQSDTESAEIASLTNSKTSTDSRRTTPDLPRRAILPPHNSQSNVTLLPDAVIIHSYSSEANTGSERQQAVPSPVYDVDKFFKKSIKHVQDPPDGVNCGLGACDQPEVPVDGRRQFVQGLDTPVPEIKQLGPTPELDIQKLFKKSISHVQNPPGHLSTLDLHDNRDNLALPMGNRSQSVPDLDMQDDEEEDIDSLVNFHKSAMASSSSSLRSTSMTSIYSDSGDTYSVDVRGEVVFTMFYDELTQSLRVLIKECRKLAYGDALRQFSNPYVKCYLLPDKSRQSKRKTTIKRHTCDPVYEETFKYCLQRNHLLTRSMLISVWHHGHLSSNPFLGEVEIALDCYDLDSPHEECMTLMTKAPCCIPASAFTHFKGEMVVSLKFVTATAPRVQKFKGKKVVEAEGGELHVLIKEAKNLMAMKGGGGTSDSFVKGYLFPSKSKTTKRKTPVMKKNLNPHYNHTFVYKELSLEQLKCMCLELTVWDREPMLSNEFLGGVRLSCGKGSVKMGNDEVGMDSVGEEVSLWQKMMQYPDSWAEGTLPLRTTMRKKKKGK